MQSLGPMPVDCGMGMPWMPMPGQSWAGAAAAFTGMWLAMMAAMMLPSVAAPLWRTRQAVGNGGAVLASAGYFGVWSLFGILVFALGAELARQSFAVPAAVVLIAAGLVQFTAFKTRHLACCRDAAVPLDARQAWQHGLRLGMHCVLSCGNWMLLLLAVGVMDWRAMLVVTAAISLERLAPAGKRVARFMGVLTVLAGVLMLAR